MSNFLKIKVSFEDDKSKALIDFILDTQDGKYTERKPDLIQVAYNRLVIQEQDSSYSGDVNNEVFLFGLS